MKTALFITLATLTLLIAGLTLWPSPVQAQASCCAGEPTTELAYCNPNGTCRACTTCNYCGHCAKGGGRCSVCR